ncbi:MAG: hypothetical protein ACM3SQ_15795 [Betaproteobacteria bacterium]
MKNMTRAGILAALVALAAVAVALQFRRAGPPLPRLTWIATAGQFGPVGYRDPAGAVSPDGRWLAYAEGRFLRVVPVGGGPVVSFPPAEGQVRDLAWSPDSRTILADGFGTREGWALYDRAAGTRRGLWLDRPAITATVSGRASTIHAANLRQPAWSPDGASIAAVVNAREGQQLWVVSADGRSARAQAIDGRVAFPAWTPGGEIACVVTTHGRSRVTIPCGGTPLATKPDLDVYGPIAFSPDGAIVYVALPNASDVVDLWAAPIAGGPARRLTSFARDAYGPTIAADGTVVFKAQRYETHVAVAPADGGPSRALALFQSETPSWDPTGRHLGLTFGTWRRLMDDARYPDISQDAGIIAVDPDHPAATTSSVVHASVSEDQSLCWSPNGRWIAFHSHQNQSDDVWLRRADGAADAPATRVSFLGRGAEVGWPRWSPDGKWLLFDGASPRTHVATMFVVGVDQESGAVAGRPREVALGGIEGEISHSEWLADGAHVAALVKEGPGRYAIVTAPRDGGDARIVHRFESEHDFGGLAVSPGGTDVAFVAPAPDGFFQVFRMTLAGGAPSQVTTDPTNKTQPAWSPDGGRIAFTVWSYQAQFWSIGPADAR